MVRIKYAITILFYMVLMTSVKAADFTFQIPVELSNMPTAINAVVVRCKVYCMDLAGTNQLIAMTKEQRWDQQPSAYANNNIIGSGQQVRSINTSTGYFNETVSVHVDTAQGLYPNNAVGAICMMKIRNSSGDEHFPQPAVGGGGGIPQDFRAYDVSGGLGNVIFVSNADSQRQIGFQNIAAVGAHCDDVDPTQ